MPIRKRAVIGMRAKQCSRGGGVLIRNGVLNQISINGTLSNTDYYMYIVLTSRFFVVVVVLNLSTKMGL